jgi:hypothetical protein
MRLTGQPSQAGSIIDRLGRVSPRIYVATSLMNQEEEIGGPRGRERRHNASNACARLNEECSCRAVEGGRGLSA